MTNPVDERAEFEAWAVSQGYQRDELARCKIGIVGPEYFNLNTENAFKAWSAGKASTIPTTAAARDVLAERQRQISAEGWTPEQDDKYGNGAMSDAAGCYALHAFDVTGEPPAWWPWSNEWWKPGSPRRNLEKAGALILAEIERLDRAAVPVPKGPIK